MLLVSLRGHWEAATNCRSKSFPRIPFKAFPMSRYSRRSSQSKAAVLGTPIRATVSVTCNSVVPLSRISVSPGGRYSCSLAESEEVRLPDAALLVFSSSLFSGMSSFCSVATFCTLLLGFCSNGFHPDLPGQDFELASSSFSASSCLSWQSSSSKALSLRASETSMPSYLVFQR